MKVPVHVLSGFLGAGKTTAVKDLLGRRADRERIAVVVNEFGTLGVDGALLSDCASCILREVPGGCVCCTAMADLEASLEEVSDLVAPTRFVLEPTGLARPSELVDLLRGPRWATRFDVRPVITLLDPQQDPREGLRRERALPRPGRRRGRPRREPVRSRVGGRDSSSGRVRPGAGPPKLLDRSGVARVASR